MCWNGCNGAGIVTALGLFHGFCAIFELIVYDNVDEVLDDWKGANIEVWGGWEADVEVLVPVPCWTTICNGGVDGWLHAREDEMEDDDEIISLSDPSVIFLALFLLGKGNSVGWIPSFPL